MNANGLFERSTNSLILMCLHSVLVEKKCIGKLNVLAMNFINILFQVENKNLFSKPFKKKTKKQNIATKPFLFSLLFGALLKFICYRKNVVD